MRVRLLLACCLLGPSLVYGETSVWTRIQELSQFSTPQGNPQLEAYLKTLTRPQMLDAARECCSKAATRVPQERWGEGVLPVAYALAFYGNREGGLSDDALNRLLDCIASEHEGDLFRETLVRLLRQRHWQHMTYAQRRQSRQSFLEVLSDKNAPGRLRVLSCRELSQALAEDHYSVIISDKNIRPLRGDRQKWLNVNGLVRAGEVRLEPETRKALKAITYEIAGVTPVLSALSQDAAETPEVKEQAQSALRAFADLPVAPLIASTPERTEDYIERYELNRRVRDAALEAGLGEADANDLVKYLLRAVYSPPPRQYAQYWEEKGFDLCAFLKRIRDFEGLPFFEAHHISQLNILLWIPLCADLDLRAWLIQFVEGRMKQPVKTEDDLGLTRGLLRALGHEGSDRALALLFRIQSKEAWECDPPFRIEIDDSSPEEIAVAQWELREGALYGIANSGTERALHAFGTGEGVANDFAYRNAEFLRTSAYVHCGLRDTWHLYLQGRIGIQPEVEAKLRAIHAEYGVEFQGREYHKNAGIEKLPP